MRIDEVFAKLVLKPFSCRYFGIIKLFCCMLIPMAIPCYFWGEPLYYAFFSSLNRFLFTLHATWSVNSVAHFWGNKPFDR